MARRIVPSTPPATSVVSNAVILGAAVRHRRTHKQVRIDDAAHACNVSVQLLSDMEGGKRNVRLDNAIRVVEEFGMSLVVVPHDRVAEVTALLGTPAQ